MGVCIFLWPCCCNGGKGCVSLTVIEKNCAVFQRNLDAFSLHSGAALVASHRMLSVSGGVLFMIFVLMSNCRPRGRGRGDAADSVYDGITNTLLAMMDGMAGFDNVIVSMTKEPSMLDFLVTHGSFANPQVIGTTNRLDLIDTALLRPGRFDLQVGLHAYQVTFIFFSLAAFYFKIADWLVMSIFRPSEF